MIFKMMELSNKNIWKIIKGVGTSSIVDLPIYFYTVVVLTIHLKNTVISFDLKIMK